MNLDLIIWAGVALLLIPVCRWMVLNDRKSRRLSDEAIARLKRDYEAAPFGTTQTWEDDR